MNLVRFFIDKKVVSAFLVILLLLAGYSSFQKLGRFEDPEFTIRVAAITTPFPGASAEQVATQVTDKIEEALQQLPEVDEIRSNSYRGLSSVQFEARVAYDKESLQQIWDKLRRKMQAVERQLPPGAGPILIDDDFGDVYGLFYALTGEGYSFSELKQTADMLRKELALVPGVAKVALWGDQPEQVYLEIPTGKLANLGLQPEQIYQQLRNAITPTATANIDVGPERLAVGPMNTIADVSALNELLLSDGKGQTFRLGDIGHVSLGYREPATSLLYFDGQPAIGLGISNISGGNIVTLGEKVSARLAELESRIPLGMQLKVISHQGETVDASIGDFVDNLIAAVLIVVVTLLLFMGMRSGLLIGFVLLLTVAATLIIMQFDGIDMHRISLGALIIALGMLVDNAIVVTEGILIRSQQGESPRDAALKIVKQTQWPLLGGTVVGIMAFSAIGLSPDNTGEYAGSLFWVILYSMLMSWLLAVTLTPLFCVLLFKNTKPNPNAGTGKFLLGYQRLLAACIRLRWPTLGACLVLLVLAVVGLKYVPPGFFPASTRAQFVVDYWLPQGTNIERTNKEVGEIAEFVQTLPDVTATTTLVGAGGLRFMLVYGAEEPNTSYAQLLVDVDDWRKIDALMPQIRSFIEQNYPDAMPKVWKFQLGPGGGSKIEAKFSGPDPKVLRSLAAKARQIYIDDGGMTAIKDDWRQPVKVIQPVWNEAKARQSGFNASDLDLAASNYFNGTTIAQYQRGSDLLPVVARPPAAERDQVDALYNVRVLPAGSQQTVPLSQYLLRLEPQWENAIIRRVDRFPTIKVQGDPATELTGVVFNRVRAKVEAIPLPPGYSLSWGGEFGDSSDANAGIMQILPIAFAAMVFTVVALFNAIRQPLIIWMIVPLAVVGVSFGLVVTQTPFEFMAMLAFLSLTGMLIKNAIVLVDQIDLEIREGKPRLRAVLESSRSRVRPVAMGAITTILGVAPLLFDPFFKSMAVTIMFGLGFATVLTLFVVPVVYTVLFRIRANEMTHS